MRAVTTQVSTELRLNLRQGEQMLVAIGIPLGILVFFSVVDVLPLPDGVERPVDFLTPGVLALAVMSSAMVSLGIATGFERQYNVLKRLGATPLGRRRLVAAKIGLVAVLEAIQVAVLVAAAALLGWTPSGAPLLAPAALLLGTAAFAGIGLLLAGTLRGTVTLALANALYLLLLLLGGMVVPLAELPDPLRALAEVLPAAALTEAFTAAVGGGQLEARPWVVLTCWAVAAPLAAIRWFRWY